MALQFTGTNGLFTRLGTIGQVLKDTNTFQGTTLLNDTNSIYAQFLADVEAEAIIDGLAPSLLGGQQAAGSYIGGFLSQVAQNIVTTMVYEDTQLLNSNGSLTIALQNVILQMQQQSKAVHQVTVASTSAAGGSNQGNGTLVTTTFRADGLTQENLLPETITCTISADSTTGATAGSEVWQVNGAGDNTGGNALSWLFPSGSAASQTVTAVNASNNDDGATLINNGDFETWVANVPNNWFVTVGTPGVQVLQAATPYTGTYSCEFAGDGSTLTTIQQQFNSASGTTETLTGYVLYMVNMWIKTSAVPAAGVLRIALVDGSGTVLLDGQGNSNSFTQDLTAIPGNTWTAINGTFRTPYLLPAAQYLQLKLTTALSNTKNLFIDRVGFCNPTQLYPGGPSFAFFSGSNNWYAPDTFTITDTNSYGSAGVATWQTLFDRLFDMKSQGLLLPYSSSGGVIPDTLI